MLTLCQGFPWLWWWLCWFRLMMVDKIDVDGWWLGRKWSHIKTSSNAIYITVSLISLSILIAASSLTGCSRNARNPTVSLCHKNLKGHVPFQRCFNISISGSSLPIRLRIPRCMAPCANWSKWGPSFVIVNRWYLVILIQLVVVETKVAGDLKVVELLVNYDLLEKMCLHLVSNYDLVSHLLFVLRGATLGTKKKQKQDPIRLPDLRDGVN